jgi:hypothetical protein
VEQARKTKRVADSAAFCVDVLTAGWQDAVAGQVSNHVSDRVWQGLRRRHRRRGCTSLAAIASAILAGKKRLHDIIGRTAGRLLSRIGGNRFEEALARELFAKIPLPVDAKLTAAARGVQIVGILLCMANGRDLSRCECFVALALSETKERLKQILAAGAGDWVHLADFPRSAGKLAAT